MKTKLKVLLVDTPSGPVAADQIQAVLQRAAQLARGRKQSRSSVSNRMVAAGYPSYRRPHPESWRHSIQRFLRRHLPSYFWIHVGGHHVAVHYIMPHQGEFWAGGCVGRLIEAQPI